MTYADEKTVLIARVAHLERQLAECQAREKVRIELMAKGCWMDAQAVPFDSTALDAMKRQWQREALLEAATEFEECNPTAEIARCSVGDELRRMAKELE